MRHPIRLLVLLAAMVCAAIAGTLPAQADTQSTTSAVFVQTNDPTGNSIDAYQRNPDGTLTFLASYATGWLGGRANGAGADPLASQGSLQYIPDGKLLLAVNAGSNTISVFHVRGNALHLDQVLSSGGLFPNSIAVHDDVVYVLDAGGPGSVSGYRVEDARLYPIPDSTRTLGLPNANPPGFLSAPAQAGFTPDGEHLVVTTKTNGMVDVFSVSDDGRLSASPVKNPTATPVPFAFVFDAAGSLVLNFAGNSSLETFIVNDDNTITPISASVSDTRTALCWVTTARGFEYGSNTGSGAVSQFRVRSNGTVVLVSANAASGIPGATDSAAAGPFLYVQSGSTGTVHAFRIGAGGALAPIQVAGVPAGASQEGIVAV